MKVKELKDIIVYLNTNAKSQLTTEVDKLVEKMLKDGTDPSYIYNTMPNDMTLYEELKDKYSNYTNLILNLSKYQKNQYKGMYDYQKKYESVG
tara:strand:- start:378 stop:656 length:279 start_codon:yes stop_codon:yes gene_type:complete